MCSDSIKSLGLRIFKKHRPPILSKTLAIHILWKPPATTCFNKLPYKILSATMKHFAFRTCALRVRRDFWQAFRTSHLGPGQIYFFPFAFRTPKQPKLELLISHFAPIRSAPITLHPPRWARQNCIAGLNLSSESKNCGIQNVYGTNRVMC